jgi:hypothetical protein
MYGTYVFDVRKGTWSGLVKFMHETEEMARLASQQKEAGNRDWT